jgi:polynucleotide 5'-hydroxyl-kinase GRC3/NOL9
MSNAPDFTSLAELVSPAEWNRKIGDILASKSINKLIAFICGPKSSGKSTFSKVLINRLVSRTNGSGVAVLDIDPGQPEFSTPGTLSLVHVTDPILSPAFCHPDGSRSHRIIRAHAIASLSPASNPIHYRECILDLFSTFRQAFLGRCPLIINTFGWVQGTGLDVLAQLITDLQPTTMVYMSKEGPEESVETLKSVSKHVDFEEIPSRPGLQVLRTAADLRAMRMMSYFHLNKDRHPDFHSWDGRTIESTPPLIVRYGDPRSGIMGIVCYEFQPPLDLLSDTINGTVVNMVEVENERALDPLRRARPVRDLVMAIDTEVQRGDDSFKDDLHETLTAFPKEDLPLYANPHLNNLDPEFSRAIGAALVRGWDSDRKEIHLLSPLPQSAFKEILANGHGIVLVVGKVDQPHWAYTEELYKRLTRSTGPAEEKFNGNDSDQVFDSEDDAVVSEMAVGGSVSSEPESGSGSDSDAGMERIDSLGGGPWLEVINSKTKRNAGRVWRVRRDLGKQR